MRTALIVSLVIGFATVAAADQPVPLTKTTHVYKQIGPVAIQADVYTPAGDEPRPVAVWIHGGALIVGSRTQVPKGLLELCTRERAILVSLDYRLAPEVKLPDIVDDLRDAIAWIYNRGPQLFHADTRRVAIVGGSAGGFLTMTAGVVARPKPTALVAYWGYGDIDGPWTRSPSTHHGAPITREDALAGVRDGKVVTNTDPPVDAKARSMYYRHLRQTGGWSREVGGVDVTQQPGALDKFCPVKQITADYPPILMIHGTEDTDVPYHCSTDMAAELKKHGVPHELITVKGAEHGLAGGDPKLVADANARALEYIRRHLFEPDPAKAKSPPGDKQPAGDKQSSNVDPEVARQLAAIAAAGPGGAGSAEARAARDALTQRGMEILPPLLIAMDTTNVIAANWYRTVYEEIVARELTQPEPKFPRALLEEYVSAAERSGRARRLVLSLIDRLEPGWSESWLPGRLADPEFRHEAIVRTLAAGDKAAKAKDTEQAKAAFRRAFDQARESGDVTAAAGKLKSLGEPVDAIKHLGLVHDWWVIGPFDAPGKTGFAATFPPEMAVDLNAKYPGQAGKELLWQRQRGGDSLAQLNLINVLGTVREAVAYAYTEIDVPQAGPAELRCGADDNCSVWLNGVRVFAREQWLNGTRFDRFITPIDLPAGKNTLLVKICQGPQHKDPEVPNNWTLQLRLCNADGRGLEFRSLLPDVVEVEKK